MSLATNNYFVKQISHFSDSVAIVLFASCTFTKPTWATDAVHLCSILHAFTSKSPANIHTLSKLVSACIA